MSTELETRLAALEIAFAEIKKLKGVPGQRGPAGPIEAAVKNAEQYVVAAEARLKSEYNEKVAALDKKYSAQVATLREELRATKSFIDGSIENAVVNHTVAVLKAYHLLDENNAPTPHADVTNPVNRITS